MPPASLRVSPFFPGVATRSQPLSRVEVFLSKGDPHTVVVPPRVATTSEPRAKRTASRPPHPVSIRRPVERVGAVHTYLHPRGARRKCALARAASARRLPFQRPRRSSPAAPAPPSRPRASRVAAARPARLSRAAAIPHAAASPAVRFAPRARRVAVVAGASAVAADGSASSPNDDDADPRGPSSARSSPSHSSSPPPSRSPTATWNHSSAR